MALPPKPVVQSFCNDTLEVNSDSITTPSSLVVKSYLGVFGAPYAVVNAPLPPVGTTIGLQANLIGDRSASENCIVIEYTIQPGDTPASVAAAMVE